jgi:hypothetical protein
MNLLSLIDELERKVPDHDKSNWHIEHTLLVINGITNTLEKSDPSKYNWSFRPIKYLVFTLNKIPRGKGKSPKVVSPTETITKDSLQNHFDRTRLKVEALNRIPKSHFFPHPYFGNLRLKQAKKFIEIHTNHHLLIINDIVKLNS